MVSARRETETALRVTIDESRCCGAGQCVLVAPQVFDQRHDGVVSLVDATPPHELHAEVRKAVDLCPTRAISLAE